jgi:hypothetical protein
MNKDNLKHMRDALRVNISDIAYNSTQKAGAELVLNILHQDVFQQVESDRMKLNLGPHVVSWYNDSWRYIANPERSFDMKMDQCIKICLTKLGSAVYEDGTLYAPLNFVFDDLFTLLLGTVDIPLSVDTATMISPDSIVLTGRNDVKEILQHDEEWIEILKQIANICDGRFDQSEKVCDSIEKYSTPLLATAVVPIIRVRALLGAAWSRKPASLGV